MEKQTVLSIIDRKDNMTIKELNELYGKNYENIQKASLLDLLDNNDQFQALVERDKLNFLDIAYNNFIKTDYESMIDSMYYPYAEHELLNEFLKAVEIKSNEIAVMAGNYYFTIVDKDMIDNAELSKTNINVKVGEDTYNIFKANTFEASQMIDKLMDTEDEFKLSEYIIETPKLQSDMSL